MDKSQKGNTMIAIIVAVVIVVVALVYFLNKNVSIPNPINQNQGYQTQPTTQIQSDKDLMSASADLDNTDLNAMDNGLNQNDADISSF